MGWEEKIKNSNTYTRHLNGRNAHTTSTRTLLLGMGKHHLLKAKYFSILPNKHLKHSIHHIIESGTGYLYYKVSNCEGSIKANTEKLLAYYIDSRSWGK